MINLYNFMDGMDGFAAGMAVAGFGALSLAGWIADAPGFGLVSGLIAAAAAGFLIWNFPPARIFMGDAGSISLGFLAAAMSLWAARDGILALWASALVFSPFIVDATVTILRRATAGERIWEPHRSHHYQRLVRLGWGHRKTVLRAYVLMSACAASALQGARMAPGDQLWLIAFWTVIYGLIGFKVALLERQHREAAP
jgi:UDP-N-acetylmuramyl pentapeptide phosphotransferase/UDP-N-acetylglucosamine-1-phosphate transferase